MFDSSNIKTAEVLAAEQIAIGQAEALADAKIKGVEHDDVWFSLSESNQNGLAAVKAGADLAIEFGGDIFPLNFNAETASGVEVVTFDTFLQFKTFSLTFMQERQAYFT